MRDSSADDARATPGTDVRGAALVRTDSGRDVTWAVSARADESGAVTFRVPYANGRNGASTAAVALETNGRSTPLPVTSENVLEGRAIGLRVGP